MRLAGNVGEQKRRARQVGTKRLFAVESLEHAVLPVEQVRVRRGKCFPVLVAAVSSYPLIDQKDVSPGNRLVIKIRLPVGGGETLEVLGKAGERFEQSITTQIEPDNAHVLLVMETFAGQRASLEVADELFV